MPASSAVPDGVPIGSSILVLLRICVLACDQTFANTAGENAQARHRGDWAISQCGGQSLVVHCETKCAS